MTNTLPISCFIIALNEADRIATTINSVKGWVDEIVVIDSGSTDHTVSLAASLGAHVLYHAWPGYGLQKRFGEEQCRNEWLLNLDADEEVTPALAEEIRALFAHGVPPEAGFTLKVRDMLPGEPKLSRFAHTNHCLRLYNKHKGRFSDSPVHDSVLVTEGSIRPLENAVLHRSFRSLSHMIDKINVYSSMQAENMIRRGRNYSSLRLLREMPQAFLKTYLLRGYMFRGWRGFIYSVIYSYGRFIRLAKYRELREKRV